MALTLKHRGLNRGLEGLREWGWLLQNRRSALHGGVHGGGAGWRGARWGNGARGHGE